MLMVVCDLDEEGFSTAAADTEAAAGRVGPKDSNELASNSGYGTLRSMGPSREEGGGEPTSPGAALVLARLLVDPRVCVLVPLCLPLMCSIVSPAGVPAAISAGPDRRD